MEYGGSMADFKNPYEFDMALLEPVWYMMRRGVKIDKKKKLEFSGEYKSRWDKFQKDLNYVAGYELNVNSSKQVKQFLYDDVGLPMRRAGGKPSANEDSLRSLMAIAHDKMESLSQENAKMRWMRGYLGIRLILKIRGLRKRLSSYVDVDIDPDGRMRTTLSVGGTETFRFSSSKTLWDTGCNLQTIPRELRSMFIADDGYEMAEFDLNRGESWVYAHLSGDPEMMRIHQTGGDFHAETACAISSLFGERVSMDEWEEFYSKDPEKGYKLRFLGKKSNHAFAYRMGPHRAAETVNESADDTGITITVGEGKKMREFWLKKYLMIPTWWSNIENELREARTLESPLGRKWTFFDRWGDSLFKEATARVPQSTSVDYLNRGMLKVYDEMVIPCRYGTELLHQNHDSILVQYRGEHRDAVMREIMDLMEFEFNVNGHDITIPVEPQYGPNWQDLTEWKSPV
jgi:DNA polymerase I-like protein with 3'-5' exonuclease and polymerase domains